LIGSLNNKLTDEQKSFIRGTPFGWMVELIESVKISRNLLTLLISRWVERLGGFDMSAEVVVFTYLDVCLGLDLRVVGENIDLIQEGLNSDSRNLFGASQVVGIDMVYDYILKHIKVLCLEDFGKLYVLFAISEFLLPNRSGTVFSILFNIVDDLGSIGKFNWGRVVYEFLVGSICEAKLFLKEKQSTKHFHVAGCVYLLQVLYFKLI